MEGITLLMNFVRDSMFGSGTSQQIRQKQAPPPRAAVVMLWSKDQTDKPSPKVRWSFDGHK